MNINGEEIKEARERAQLTQQELADIVGVSRRSVGSWERGESIPRNRLAAVREALGIESNDESGKKALARLLDMWLVREGMGPDKFARAVNPANFRLVYAWRAGTSAPQKKNRPLLEDVLGWRRGSVTEVLEASDSIYWGLDRVEPAKEAQPLLEARELSTPDLVQELMRRVLEMDHELSTRNAPTDNVRSLFGLAADKNGNAGQEDIETD